MVNREGQTNDFGSRLRDARERRGMSLRQIANATKISVTVLEALERNDISRLPGGIFGRAFVRSYAVEVGLDPERTIQEFITRFPHDSIVAGHPAVRHAELQYIPERSARLSPVLVLAMAVIVAAAGLAIHFRGWRALASYASPLITERREPELPLPPGVSAPGPAGAEDPVATGDPDRGQGAAAPATSVSTATADDRLTIRLSVSRPCWISAMVDGRKAIERLLQTGEDQTIDVRRELVLTAADAGAVALTLNGAIARPLGSAGEVVTARLSLANFRDFLSNR
jgi:cytoskeleton protein RodZ